jgi:LPXTG-site transpeptidase (sortase) family protein
MRAMMRRVWLCLLAVCVCAWVGGALYGQESALIIPTADRQLFSGPLDAVALRDALLVSGGRDNSVRVWNANTGENRAVLAGHGGWVTRVAISPDGQTILSGSQDMTVRMWDVRNNSLRFQWTHHTQSVTGVAFSADGRLVASTALDGTIWLGDAQTGAQITVLTNYNSAAWGVAFSPDGRWLATGSEDGTIWLWGLADNGLVQLQGHTGAVTALAFNAAGTRLVSGSWDKTARVWQLSDNSSTELRGHDGPVTGVGFSGDAIITAGLDGAARVWRGDSALPAAVLQGDGSALGGLALSGDGARLVTAGIDGVLDVWEINARVWPLVEAGIQPTAAPTSGAQYVSLVAPPASDPQVLAAQLPVFTPPPTAIRPTRAPSTAAPRPTLAAQGVAADGIAPTQPPRGGTTLELPTVNIYAPIKTFYLDGVSWAIDPWEPAVGHLQGTAWVETAGNIALGGHSEYPDGRAGVFKGLYGLSIGDPIVLTVNGVTYRYTVNEIRSVSYDDISVVYPSTDRRLTLITCDIPSYDASTNFYSERLVVIATGA